MSKTVTLTLPQPLYDRMQQACESRNKESQVHAKPLLESGILDFMPHGWTIEEFITHQLLIKFQ